MNSKVDLHMHTVVSDGTDTIPELLKKIQTLGITNGTHCTCRNKIYKRR